MFGTGAVSQPNNICHPQTHDVPMEDSPTRFQRGVHPGDEGRVVSDLLISTNSLCCYDTWPGGHEDDIWRAQERDESSDWGKRGDKVKLWNKAISEIFQTSFWPERSGLRPSRLDLGQPSTSSTPRPINTSIKDTCSENLKKKTAWEICNLLQKSVISFCHYHSDENSYSSKYYRTVYIEENTIGICWGDATPPLLSTFWKQQPLPLNIS